ncbi:unnamed protein product [Caenorhabditis auriculariae]|uniref:Uncharacterized protein n=1 Tax=Caenorhabditis auriculariae TaxID=2777116 RepID=A0A8S1HYX3_9PELO|nr:unnamed protein product [Caenorhabditis auriculariae]
MHERFTNVYLSPQPYATFVVPNLGKSLFQGCLGGWQPCNKDVTTASQAEKTWHLTAGSVLDGRFAVHRGDVPIKTVRCVENKRGDGCDDLMAGRRSVNLMDRVPMVKPPAVQFVLERPETRGPEPEVELDMKGYIPSDTRRSQHTLCV